MKKLLLGKLFLLCALIMGSTCMWAQTTYSLQKVTSVESGARYVFEQDGYVMNNTIISGALQTTNSYKTTGLTGTESYVWELSKSGSGFYMKNNSKYHRIKPRLHSRKPPITSSTPKPQQNRKPQQSQNTRI